MSPFSESQEKYCLNMEYGMKNDIFLLSLDFDLSYKK